MWEGVSSLAGWGFKSLHGQSALCGKGCPAWQGGGFNHYTDKGLYVGRGVRPGRVGVLITTRTKGFMWEGVSSLAGWGF